MFIWDWLCQMLRHAPFISFFKRDALAKKGFYVKYMDPNKIKLKLN
jgi:hypothetical protein